MPRSVLLYDLMTFLYAVCIVLYFADFVTHKQVLNRIAYGFLAVVWGLQTSFFLTRMTEVHYVPLMTTFETTLFFSWLLITFSLVINYFYKIDLFAFFTNVIGFAMVVFDLFTGEGASSVVGEGLQGNLLIIHITLAFLSYAAFSLSFIFSIMYLIQSKMLKEKRWNSWFRRLPALDKLDAFTYRLIIVGFPMLLLALILGVNWYYKMFGSVLVFDAKPLVSIVLLGFYVGWLYLRNSFGWSGRKLAWWNVASFSLVVVNYLFVGTFFSGFHRW
ncbi:cytochrome c biogenesis protein CcsA [Tumebacillus sp. ITR2]|uniref:Cytochrome c biogenesis protein CcsA n=1 Tax=Tumebacillus amylolyticus TaxID=2801339 RepID=A0ABS1JA13_9BACL|nr:cytochrome c biogenesis protein [Tumebacillus amylolyticus]MBL0387127.1 cytochrome c biogenesis protein CcsA [Tumebacillus amylolyticus]